MCSRHLTDVCGIIRFHGQLYRLWWPPMNSTYRWASRSNGACGTNRTIFTLGPFGSSLSFSTRLTSSTLLEKTSFIVQVFRITLLANLGCFQINLWYMILTAGPANPLGPAGPTSPRSPGLPRGPAGPEGPAAPASPYDGTKHQRVTHTDAHRGGRESERW